MVQKIKPVTKVRKTRRVGNRRRLTMKGLYYREMIDRIFNSDTGKTKNDCEKDNIQTYVKEHNVKEKHFLDKYA